MPKVKEYFQNLPFSFKNAAIAMTIVTILVTLQSYLWVGKVKNRTDFWVSDHALFPLLNHSIWLLFIPLIYMLLLKLQESNSSTGSLKNKYASLLGMSIAFTVAHEFIGVIIYNLIILVRNLNATLQGDYYFNISSGIFGLSKTFFEFWIIYFVLLSFHNQLNARRFQFRNSQLQADLLKAQMSALKNQLHPHFLFNSFNTISALMEENTEMAQRMISKLGALLRKILSDGDTQFNTIQKEIELAKLYLEVEQIRFNGKLVTKFALDPSIDDLKVPSLILQPAIENAIKHGFYKKKDDCEIAIKTYQDGDYICMEVEDNGAGVKNESDFSFGIGLRNIQERLSRCYEEGYEFSANPRKNEGGFHVKVKIHKQALDK